MDRRTITNQKEAFEFLLRYDMHDKIISAPGVVGSVGMFNLNEDGMYCVADLHMGKFTLTIFGPVTLEAAYEEYMRIARHDGCELRNERAEIYKRQDPCCN